MKTNFRRKNNVFGRYIVIAVLILVFILSGLIQPIASAVSVPVIYIKQLLKVYPTDQELLEENRILRERLERIQFELATKSNQKADLDEGYVSADVLIRPSQNIYGTLVVKSYGDAEVGDQVVSESGVFLGVVREVNFSRVSVELVSHPGFQGDFTIERSGLPIKIKGVGGGNMRAELPKDSDIQNNDVVVDLETGRIVAEVGEIEADEASAFMKIYLRTPINVFEITDVLIVKI